MFFKIILGYISGYMKIVVEGYFIERFINICISKNILLWNIKREKSTILIANISIDDFRKLKKVAKITKCKVKIKDKKGVPFLFYRYQKRKIFALLLVLTFLGLFIMSNYIWNIDIKCDEPISTNEIIQILNENGLSIGKNKKTIDKNKIINAIRFKRNDIAWVGIKLPGTNAVIEIVKAKEKPEIIKLDEFCNIISEKEGIITKINVHNGTAAVKTGDLVKKRNNTSYRINRRKIYGNKVCTRFSRYRSKGLVCKKGKII